MAPNPFDIASDGIRTLRAFGQRIPGAGDVLARSLKDAVAEVADVTGVPRRELYQRALELSKEAGHAASH